ncbi:uncharacterized protein LOC115624794 [Scaptodrosophila lebanonensis]|uniref:Uncharacterized protein LOC115624794 n=1 Tax=Drosophila lebanonensis TaxID=7225 RepID=A0A6J2TKF0_DROLE|nr:uncharacterized protein LOC115624794 [Scaptodrosophila lebanonensis]
MSKRVSIILPGEEVKFALVSAEGSSARNSANGSSIKSPLRSSLKGSSIKDGSPRGSTSTIAKETTNRGSREDVSAKDESSKLASSALVPSSDSACPEETSFSLPDDSDGCQRYDKTCSCCHCVEMRHAHKRVAFLRTPEGKRRLEMKMCAKNLFMDICAMAHVRNYILNRLHGTKELHPSPRVSYPVSISNVERLDSNSLIVDWYVHDPENVRHYDIYVEGRLAKRIYSPDQTTTIILDVDVRQTQRLRMRAVPFKGGRTCSNIIDTIVREVCCVGMENIMKGGYFCECLKSRDAVKQFYKKNSCKSMVDFWKDSEFLYMPACTCEEPCDCECFPDMCEE